MADDFASSLTGSNRDAFVAINALFESYGLGTLGPKIVDYLKNGYGPDVISDLLVTTPEYKARFAGNDARLKKGLPVLSPAQYLATENSYRQIMQAAGLPIGFYDKPEDFQKFIEDDKSPSEIQARVKAASDFVNQADANTLQQFKQFYTTGDMIAYALDPDRAAPLVEKSFNASRIAGQAQNQGIGIDKGMAETLANRGVSQDQASQGFSLIGSEKDAALKLGSIYGETNYTTNDLVKETFLNDTQAAQTRARLASKERASFGGASSTGQDTLSRGSAGNF